MFFIKVFSFVLFGSLAMAASTPREGYLDLVQKAQNLMLQKDRLQASRVLLRGLEHETTVKARDTLLATLHSLSELFFTDKGQQLFEMGQTLRLTALPSAVEKFREAWALEAGNIQVGRALSRALLQSGACDEAATIADKALSFDPYADDLVLTMAQALVCLNKTADGRILLKRLELRKGPYRLYIETLRAQAAVFEGKAEQADEFLKKAQELDSEFPEIYYWKSQAATKLKKNGRAPAERYVELCTRLETKKMASKYGLEPRLCSEKEAVQKRLASGQFGEAKTGVPK